MIDETTIDEPCGIRVISQHDVDDRAVGNRAMSTAGPDECLQSVAHLLELLELLELHGQFSEPRHPGPWTRVQSQAQVNGNTA